MAKREVGQSKRKQKRPTKWTAEKAERFLFALRQGYSVSHAAGVVGCARQTLYDHREADKAFAAAWDEAIEGGTDVLEDEARRRAFVGVMEPVFHKGEQVATVRKYSDTLLIFLLNGRRPEKFRHRFEHSGPGGGAIPLTLMDLALAAQRK